MTKMAVPLRMQQATTACFNVQIMRLAGFTEALPKRLFLIYRGVNHAPWPDLPRRKPCAMAGLDFGILRRKIKNFHLFLIFALTLNRLPLMINDKISN